MSNMPYGFRIVGTCQEDRRLVNAAAAFSGYASCSEKAEIENESYLSAFQFGDEFKHLLKMTGSTKGYRGPCWSPWLWIDIDRENQIDIAHTDTKRLAAMLVERYQLDGDELLIFYSGLKGFHVGLSTAIWSPAPSGNFNKVARQFAESIAGLCKIEIDSSVYDKVRAFRAPNSRHPKAGLHKRRISFDELLQLSTEAIIELARSPQPFEIPFLTTQNGRAVDDWSEATRQTAEAETVQKQGRSSGGNLVSLNRQTMDFICNGAAAGDRHQLLFSAAANLAEFDCPTNLARALLTESALDSGLSPSEVRRQIACGLSHFKEGFAKDEQG